jgi:hypothetical protein
MRRALGTLFAALLTVAMLVVTAGCGSSSSSVATGPASDPAGVPSRSPGPVSGAKVLPLISMTGIGGRADSPATLLDTPSQIAGFVGQFPHPGTQKRLEAEIDAAAVPAGDDLYGQVIAVGCDRPPGADVMVDKGGNVELVPHEVASPLEECLVAVTTVGLAVVPSD